MTLEKENMKTLLIVTYLSFANIPSVRAYEMHSMTECKQRGKEITNNVRAGRVSTVCWSVQ